MLNVWLYSIGSVLIVSLLSFVGLAAMSFGRARLGKMLFVVVSFSVGALLGDVFLHILPEVWESAPGIVSMFYVFAGFMIFFILEKFLRWHHYHHTSTDDESHGLEHHKLSHIGYLNVVSDGLHNFVDGAVIAGSFLVSIPVGISTSIAVFLHEIPQEIGDFGLLLHAGFSTKRALFWNFCSALGAVAGALIVLVGSRHVGGISNILLPITAGGFLYVAGSDLVPELNKIEGVNKSLIQLVGIALGFILMALLLMLE